MCFCSCLIFVAVVVLVSTINNKTFFLKKNQYRSPLCLHINHHHRHKYPLNEILYNNITERYKLEGLIETVYLLTMQFLPTNNQWKAMLLYYRVNKLQKILVTAWRRRKRLTVAGFFLNMKTDQKTSFLYNIFIDLLFWTDNRLIWYLVKCTSSVRFKENKFKTPISFHRTQTQIW